MSHAATIIGSYDGTVESVHPFVLIDGGPVVDARKRTADDYEDLDALPVEEQAAIVCAVNGSDRDPSSDVYWFGEIPVSSHATDFAREAGRGMRVVLTREGVADKWAEAEARIRNGEVRT